jgi:hypothetical protein
MEEDYDRLAAQITKDLNFLAERLQVMDYSWLGPLRLSPSLTSLRSPVGISKVVRQTYFLESESERYVLLDEVLTPSPRASSPRILTTLRETPSSLLPLATPVATISLSWSPPPLTTLSPLSAEPASDRRRVAVRNHRLPAAVELEEESEPHCERIHRSHSSPLPPGGGVGENLSAGPEEHILCPSQGIPRQVPPRSPCCPNGHRRQLRFIESTLKRVSSTCPVTPLEETP